MKASCRYLSLRILLVVVVVSCFAFGAIKEKGLYAFQGGSDGQGPEAQLITDTLGNLYGTTASGGIDCGLPDNIGCGTVFELVAPASPNENWQELVLYRFGGANGAFPFSSLTFDGAGNLYGVTSRGGDIGNPQCRGYGCGLVFELSPPNQPGGSWTETVLHIFGGGSDGAVPESPVVFDSGGNLYGTTLTGGRSRDCTGCGVAYELSPSSGSDWQETIILTFPQLGAYPQGAIVLDSAGNLYGTTQGDSITPAIVFELTPGNPDWSEVVIADIAHWGNGVVQGNDGNLYGSAGGRGNGAGTVFQLVRSGEVWTQHVLYAFDQQNGIFDPGPVTIDESLNIYLGAASSRCGGVLKLTPEPSAAWKASKLYAFNPTGAGGCVPVSALVLGKWGGLYGTTAYGGSSNDGVIFAVEP